MTRLIIAVLIGAGLMYFFDPRQGSERRQMLADRANQAGRGTMDEARSRFQKTAQTTGENARETMDEAQRQGREFAEDTREHARAFVGDDNA